MGELIKFFSIWAVLGYFIVLTLPKPKNKVIALFQLLIAGPLCWMIFIPASLDVIMDSRRTTK